RQGAGKSGELLCVCAPWRLCVKIYSPAVFIAEAFQSVYTVSMASNESQPQKARPLAARLIFAVLKILKENGGEMRGRQVLEEVEKRVQLGEWEKQRYEKTGNIRWRSVLHFYTIDLIKAGFLIKKKGIWFLTPEGESALKLGETG